MFSDIEVDTHCCISHHVAVDQDTDTFWHFSALFKAKLSGTFAPIDLELAPPKQLQVKFLERKMTWHIFVIVFMKFT